jgi:hypothetical protein
VNDATTDAAPEPRKPYVPPAVDELGGVDDQTGFVGVGYFAEPGSETPSKTGA